MFYFNISINHVHGLQVERAPVIARARKYSPDFLLRGLQVEPAPVARVGSAQASRQGSKETDFPDGNK